jgi:hypothetical protein
VSRRCQADMDDALRRALHPATQPVAG